MKMMISAREEKANKESIEISKMTLKVRDVYRYDKYFLYIAK